MPGRIAKVPQIMQMEALECGAACLAMILAYYGRWVPLEQMRVDCGISRDGSNAYNIINAAKRYGLDASGRALTVKALRVRNSFPCILFWNFSHFVVLDGFRGRYAYLNDPARGQIRVPMKEFEESFSGIALFFKKTPSFQSGGSKPDYIKASFRYLKGLGVPVFFVMLSCGLASFTLILSTSMGRIFFDRILSERNPDWLTPLVLLMLALAIIWGIASVINALLIYRIQGKVAVVNSSRFMRHLLHLPMEFYAQRFVGDLQLRQSSNEMIAAGLIGQVAPVLINVVMLVLYAGIMLSYSPLLTLVGISTVVINALTARYISTKRVNIARSNAVNTGKLYAATVGGVEMIETIKSAGAEEGVFTHWAGYQAAANADNVRMAMITERLSVIPAIMTRLADILVLLLGIRLIIYGEFTAGALLAFTGFLTAFMQPVTQLIGLGQDIQELQTQIERVEDVLRYPADTPYMQEEPEAPLKTGLDKLTGEIELKDLTFGYSPLEDPLIENFNLHVKPGQWIALVGKSGSGKSTLARLISGLYKPWSGEILFDGKPAPLIPRQVMTASVSVVDQDIVCFEDSISDNIRLWDRSLEDYELILACT